ncbi:unnamed protein product [Cochlearia groenlandica]
MEKTEIDKKSSSSSSSSSSVSDVGAWAINVTSSVGIIMANKQLMSSSGFAFSFVAVSRYVSNLFVCFGFCSDDIDGISLCTHCSLVGLASNATGLSASRNVPLWELLWFSLVANISIAAMNFSLMLNSVGFYQISKLSMIPVVCVMEWVLHSKHYSREVKASVMVVVLGVGVCTLCILVSCALAVFCNISQYLCIGRFSATSFQVLGHMKTVCVLTLGWLLFDSEMTFKNIAGMVLAVVGMVIYSWAVDLEKQRKSKATPQGKNSMTEDEIMQLREEIEQMNLKDMELGDSKA